MNRLINYNGFLVFQVLLVSAILTLSIISCSKNNDKDIILSPIPGPLWESGMMDFTKNITANIAEEGRITINSMINQEVIGVKMSLLAAHTEPDFLLLPHPEGDTRGRKLPDDTTTELLIALRDPVEHKNEIRLFVSCEDLYPNKGIGFSFGALETAHEFRINTPWHIPATITDTGKSEYTKIVVNDEVISNTGKLLVTEIVQALKSQETVAEFPDNVKSRLLAFRTEPDYRTIPFNKNADNKNGQREIPDTLKLEVIMAVGSDEELAEGNCAVYLYWNDVANTKAEYTELSGKVKLRLNTPWLYAKGVK